LPVELAGQISYLNRLVNTLFSDKLVKLLPDLKMGTPRYLTGVRGCGGAGWGRAGGRPTPQDP